MSTLRKTILDTTKSNSAKTVNELLEAERVLARDTEPMEATDKKGKAYVSKSSSKTSPVRARAHTQEKIRCRVKGPGKCPSWSGTGESSSLESKA